MACLHPALAQNVGFTTSVSQREVDGLSHRHVSGYPTVTSLAAKARSSALSFGETMVNTRSSRPGALREAVLGREPVSLLAVS